MAAPVDLSAGFRRARHLAGRLAGMAWPAGPGRAGDEWATCWMNPLEAKLWYAISRRDRRHALKVARRVHTALGPEPGRAVMSAALLHDVGKIESSLGAWGRVVATVAGVVCDRSRVEEWSRRRGLRGRMGRYLAHPAIGADLLADAGSDPLAIAWAAGHHREPAAWGVPVAVGRILKAADGE